MLLSLKQKFLKVRLTVPCMLAHKMQEHPEGWPCPKNMSSLFLPAWRAEAIKQAKTVLRCLSAQCIEKSSSSCSSRWSYVQCHVTVKWSKVCLSNAVPATHTSYNHKHIQTSPIVLKKGKKKSQQQAYPSHTLSHRDNQFTGAGTPLNAPVILFLAA